MRLRFLLALLAAGLTAQAQTMTVARLVEWLRNPATANESDAALARFLSRVKLGDRLEDSAIESLRGKVLLGPKTMDALRKLRDQSKALALTAPTAADPQFAIPALVFCFLAILRLSRLRLSDGNSAAQPISFLTVHVSRAPPLA